jgi:uncharacterized membrane protein YfcA
MQAFEYIVAGGLVGMLVGLTGVGGGSLMTPLLIFLFGFNPAVAVGTDLLFASGTKIAGAAAHQRQSQVRWDVVRQLCAGSVPGALAGLALLAYLGPTHEGVLQLMTFLVGATVLATGIITLAGDRLRPARAALAPTVSRVPRGQTIAVGAFIGVLVALTSIGAGALCAIALLWLYRDGMSAAERVGTDVAHAIPVTLVAGAGHALMGHLNLPLLGWLLLGSVPCVVVGSLLSSRVPDRALKALLGGVLVLVGVKLLL